MVPSSDKLLRTVETLKSRVARTIDRLLALPAGQAHRESLLELKTRFLNQEIKMTGALPRESTGPLVPLTAQYEPISGVIYITRELVEDQATGGNLEWILGHELGHAVIRAWSNEIGELTASAFGVILLDAIGMRFDAEEFRKSRFGQISPPPPYLYRCSEAPSDLRLLELFGSGPDKSGSCPAR